MFKSKDQIAYMPKHAEGDTNHPDVEYGFIMTGGFEYSFCRYWLKGQPGVLRTKSCSERTPNNCLYKYKLCTWSEIETVYKGIEAESSGVKKCKSKFENVEKDKYSGFPTFVNFNNPITGGSSE